MDHDARDRAGPEGFCRRSRVLIVAGKGGVGKTTVCAAVARMASRLGLSVLVLAVERPAGDTGNGPSALPPAGARLEPGTEVFSRLAADAALLEYLDSHGLGRLSRRLARSGVVEVAATAVPGIKDVLLLGKVRQLETAGAADLIVVDAPASGHAARFLGGARALAEIVAGGPLRSQADQVAAMLADPARCRALLVTLAEETPVNETVETAFALEDRVGLRLEAVVVNALYPRLSLSGVDPLELGAGGAMALDPALGQALAEAARFRTRRQELQATQVERLADGLPLAQLHLPFLFAGLAPDGIDPLADALAAALSASSDPIEVGPQ